MNKTIEGETANVYMIPIKSNRNSSIKRERNNHSLPSIAFDKSQKVNNIRRQIQQSNNQIIAMRARIAALKHYKQKTQTKKNKNMMQIHFLQTVRQRLHQDKQQKKAQKERKQQQLLELHRRASLMRQTMSKGLDMAKSTLREQKVQQALDEKNRQKYDNEYLNEVRTLQLEENRLKAKQVKRGQLQSLEKLKYFQQSRLTLARGNYEDRIMSSIKQRKKADRQLKFLRQEQDSLILDVKQLEKQMRQTQNQLQNLNPERHYKLTSSKVSEVKLI